MKEKEDYTLSRRDFLRISLYTVGIVGGLAVGGAMKKSEYDLLEDVRTKYPKTSDLIIMLRGRR